MNKTPKKLFIGGNWKSNGSMEFVEKHCEFLNNIQFDNNKVEVCIAPINIHLTECRKKLNSKYYVSSQNISPFGDGAYTGEVTAKQLKDINIDWTLIGHSERRTYFHEDEELIAKKIEKALESNMNIILCIGEKSEERESNKTFDVINVQMDTVFNNIKNNWDKIVIAYEPVWAIGTGKNATPEQAQDVHEHIRKKIKEKFNDDIANKVRIIYGGSCNEKNCKSLIEKNDIDGFLVGGASLKPAFSIIIDSVKNKK